eukprot:Seg2003.1 transcript_id=Seg2003.1/GoldUCD/mRNA.D3Y31 product="Apical junction component 1-like" protein_id=Seg2003.1/GoldUCD/D3Y31
MFSYLSYKGCFPRLRLRSNKESRRLSVKDKRKRIISEPVPIVESSPTVEKLLGFNDNNNVFLLTEGSSINESPCHRGFNRLFLSETASAITEYHSTDTNSEDDQVFVETPPRRASICSPYPPKPPRMKQRRTFICQNRGCPNTDLLFGRTQVLFKSCSFCFTHYCSAKCQNENLTEHMNICFYGNVDSKLTKLVRILHDNEVGFYFSKLANEGYLTKGKGCLFMTFSSLRGLDEFLEFQIAGVRLQPSYSAIADVKKCCVSNKYRQKLLGAISNYDPTTQFIVNIAVVVGHQIPNNPVPRNREVTVRKIAIVELNKELQPSYSQIFTLKECKPFQKTLGLEFDGRLKRRKSI